MFGPQVQPNDQMKSMSKVLYVILSIGLILAVCKFFGGSMGSSMALNEIMGLMLLLCGVCCNNYCMFVFYIVLVLFSMLQIVMLIGKDIQNQNNPFNIEGAGFGGFQFFYIIMIITFFYDIVSCLYCFRAYKLYKYETMKGFGGMANELQTSGQNQPNGGEPAEDFTAFRGQGVRIG